jgi:hypothetical protein
VIPIALSSGCVGAKSVRYVQITIVSFARLVLEHCASIEAPLINPIDDILNLSIRYERVALGHPKSGAADTRSGIDDPSLPISSG